MNEPKTIVDAWGRRWNQFKTRSDERGRYIIPAAGRKSVIDADTDLEDFARKCVIIADAKQSGYRLPEIDWR